MSLVAVAARVEAIQQMLEPPAPSTAAGGGFEAALSTATAAAPPAGAAGAGLVPGSSSGYGVGVPGAPVASATGLSAPFSGAPVAGGPFAAEINAAAAKYGVDPALLRGLVRAESNFNPRAQSGAGAMGLTQLMPGTARGLGVTDPFDPVQSLEGGAKYLRQQLDAFGGDEAKALAAYNAGPGAVRQYGGVPPYAETQAYVQKIMGWVAQERGGGSGLSYSTT